MGHYDAATIDYVSVLEAVPQPIAVCNIEGEVLFLNAMARKFLKIENKDELPRFALADRDTFSQVRIDETGPLKEYFLADVEVRGAGRDRASLSLSPLGEEHYRVVLEAAPRAMVAPILDELDALVAICDQRRRIRLSNAALSRLTARLDEEGRDWDVLTLFAEADRPQLRVAASKALAGSLPEELSVRLNSSATSGAEHLRVRIRPLQRGEDEKWSHRRGFLMVAQAGKASIAELEERFARAEELMSLGEMATGVAHELKNPLTSILNYAQYLMKKYRGQFLEDGDRRRLQRIIDGVEHIDAFVRDLLNLADADGLTLSPVDLHETLRSSVELNRRTLREHQVEMKWDLGAGDPVIAGHEGGLKQVFSNLILNAAKAMPPQGGTITIRSADAEKGVIVEVEDTAAGMTEEIRNRIFEPFFSARSDGRGTGLGLALVQRLVDQHGGEIEVESTPGVGSCFQVSLPGEGGN